MGVRSCYYAAFYGWIGVISVICMAVGFDIYFKGGQDCKYQCPLMTLDSATMNTLLSAAGAVETYDSTVATSFLPCTTTLGFCFKNVQSGSTYENACVDAATIQGMSIAAAYEARCLYCDSSGTVYWPSQKVSATTQWIPTNDCGEAYENSGLTGSDVTTPSYSTIEYKNSTGSSVYVDISSMGSSYFPEISMDLEHYPYCEGTDTIGWQKSAIDQKAGETVLMLLLLCIYYAIMAFCCFCVSFTFYHFSKYEKDDWSKLGTCERWFSCLAKQMQLVLRIANTISVIFVVILFYNIWVLGVCTYAGNEFGEKRFYPAIKGYTMFVLLTFATHCFGGCAFRQKCAMETAFYTPKHVFHVKEQMAFMDYVKKYWICCCKYYNLFGGP
eukprot:g2292.t1